MRASNAPEPEPAETGQASPGGIGEGTSSMPEHVTVRNTLKHVRIGRAYFPSGEPISREVFDTRSRRLTAAEVSAALDKFVRSDGWDPAIATLRRTHCLVVCGRSGIGKSTAAINLLNDLDVKRIERIQPAAELTDLDKIEIAKGTGYVVFDHTAVVKADAEADYLWASLSAKLAQQNAYLVLTRASPTSFGSPVTWLPPDPGVFVRRRIRESRGPAIQAELLEYLPDDWSVGRLAQACASLDGGADLSVALEIFEVTAQRDVENWLDCNADNDEQILDAVALCFLSGVGEARFERAVTDLRQLVLPEAADDDAQVPRMRSRVPGRRGRRNAENTIFAPGVGTQRGVSTRVVAFRTTPHWRHAVERLYTTYGADWWTPVSEWLPRTLSAARSEEEVWPVAQGLFFLCGIDLAETIETHLVPLSRGAAGETGLKCAVAVLLFLAADSNLGGVALQLAQAWVRNECPISQRLVAADALIGELGVRYPDAAVRRLWQLLSQDEELGKGACLAPGLLLASLEEAGAEPFPVVQFLHEKVINGLGKRASLATRTTVCEVLCAVFGSDVGGRRGGVAMPILARNDAAARQLSGAFAVALRYVPYRRKLLESLWSGLDASDYPLPAIRALGAVLLQELSEEGRRTFHQQLVIVDKQQRAKSKGRAAIGREAVLAFLGTLSSDSKGSIHV